MRGQGLPFSTIVLAIISILILVLIVFFVTGGVSRLFPVSQRYMVTNVEAARGECQKLLADAQMATMTSSEPAKTFKNSTYCKTKFNINGTTYYCYSDVIGVKADFEVTTTAGERYRCNITESGTTPSCECTRLTG